uniref:Uncharacterized protein n=1 Tax=Rhizophora mucronata TaxID=61149 RepID=A0A2P2KWQ2_RHIMU
MLELKSKEKSELSNKLKSHENAISRIETNDDEEQKALEELVKENRDAKETHLVRQKIMDLCSEIEIYRRDKDELEMQMEQLALDYEILKQANQDMTYKVEQHQLEEQLKMQYECSSCPKINDLEAQIENLENELKKQSMDYYDALTSINELETNIKFLEEECEKQARGFDADLEAAICAKVEQEQRAIRAEEELHKTRWKNANTAEKLQEEFKKLSMQMASTFDANEKVAMKALAEASELRAQKSQVEEMLQGANEELQSVRDGYEAKMLELSNKLSSEMDEMEHMLAEIGDKSRQLDHQKKHEEEHVGALSQEVLSLKSDLESLTMDKNLLAEQAEQDKNMRIELEKMKTLMEQAEVLVQRGNMERHELVNTIDLKKKEAEKSLEELNRMTSLKDEKEKALCLLQAEVEALKVQCDDLKDSIFEDEQEKEKLRKQVFQLKGELKKKEEAFTHMEKKLKENNKRTTFSDGTKITARNNKSAPVTHSFKEVANLKEKIKSLEGQIKSRETALETSARSFFEKERELQKTIEDLESRVEELNQSVANFCNNPQKKLVEGTNGIASNSLVTEDLRSLDQNLISAGLISKENGNAIPLANSNDTFVSDKELNTCSGNSRHYDNETLLCELASLKEKNESMESELKEMQERYSEISLKFAEVEGERQKLVMTLRNLKNAKKI